MNTNLILQHTQQWIELVVIGCNFCPFAAKPFLANKVRIAITDASTDTQVLDTVQAETELLEFTSTLETTLIVLPQGYENFLTYLNLVETVQRKLRKWGYEGVYQLASFHPEYCFGDAPETDPANYTNRSPYPILHLLREESIAVALERFPNPDSIPERNIAYTNAKGLEYMRELLARCMQQ